MINRTIVHNKVGYRFVSGGIIVTGYVDGEGSIEQAYDLACQNGYAPVKMYQVWRLEVVWVNGAERGVVVLR